MLSPDSPGRSVRAVPIPVPAVPMPDDPHDPMMFRFPEELQADPLVSGGEPWRFALAGTLAAAGILLLTVI
jgi:hypothetical protein